MTKFNRLTRRHFLRAAGTLVALPALESLGFRRFASAATTATPLPKRAIFLGFGYDPERAFIRARITYFHQVGQYAMGITEDRAIRRRLRPLYREVLVGDPPNTAAPSPD